MEKWASSLSLCLTGEALTVVSRMSSQDAQEYEKLTLALLKRFRYTSEGYREMFRGSRPEVGETGQQFADRLTSYFDWWIEVSRTYEGIHDQMIADQFRFNCHSKLAVYLREKDCHSVESLSVNADRYLSGQGQKHLDKIETGEQDSTSSTGNDANRRGIRKNDGRCFLCETWSPGRGLLEQYQGTARTYMLGMW